MKRWILTLVACFISSPLWAQIDVPYTFVPNTVASSNQVNINFETIGQNALNRANGTITGNITVDQDVTIDGVDIGKVLGGNGSSCTNCINTGDGSFIDTTGPQLIVGYDPTHGLGISIDQSGNGTIDLFPDGAILTFKDPVTFEKPITIPGITCLPGPACIQELQIINANPSILARVADPESITGGWTFTNYTYFDFTVTVFRSPSTGPNTRNWAIHTPANTFQILTLNDGLSGITAALSFTRDAAGGIAATSMAGANISLGGHTTVFGNFLVNTGHHLQSDGSLGLFMNGSQIQMFSDNYYWTNKANNAQIATLNSGGIFTAAKELRVENVRILPSGAQTQLMLWPVGGRGSFMNEAGLITLQMDDGGIILEEGGPITPSLRFSSQPSSGMYYNSQAAPNGRSVDIGSNFNSNTGRALIRFQVDSPRIDFMSASDFRMSILTDRVIVGETNPLTGVRPTMLFFVNGHAMPAVHNTWALGSAFPLYWTHAYVAGGMVQLSDENQKDFKGPIVDALSAIDSLSPSLASWKKGVIKEEGYDGTLDIFPTFSAQEVSKTLDAKWGTQIARQMQDKSWAMNYGRLTPILWQGTKELNAKVKALEAKVEAQHLALAALEMKLDRHKH